MKTILLFFIIKLLKLANWRRSILKAKIDKARSADTLEYNSLVSEYEAKYQQWHKDKVFAERIQSRDIDAYQEVISSKTIVTGGHLRCSSLSIRFDGEVLIIEADVLPDNQIIPDTIYSVTKSGKLSEKDFPITRYNQLYQDYICSVALAVSRIFLDMFPLEKVVVNAMSEVLNKATGNLERQTLLSVFIPKSTLCKINFKHIDPSDCMENFIHKMNFKNTSGMAPIEQLVIKQGLASYYKEL